MSYPARKSSLAAALFMSSALATTTLRAPAATYEARLMGALAVDLRGTTAEFGTVPGSSAPFVITLGATRPRRDRSRSVRPGAAGSLGRAPMRSRPSPRLTASRRSS